MQFSGFLSVKDNGLMTMLFMFKDCNLGHLTLHMIWFRCLGDTIFFICKSNPHHMISLRNVERNKSLKRGTKLQQYQFSTKSKLIETLYSFSIYNSLTLVIC